MDIINTKESKAFLAELANLLKKKGEVKVTNLGIFEIREMKARKGVNPKTGASIEIPARKKIALRISSVFKKQVLG